MSGYTEIALLQYERMKEDTERFRVIFCCELYDPVVIME